MLFRSVVLDDVTASGTGVSLRIKGEAAGARFRTQFIGREGRVLAEVAGLHPHYEFKGDESYVRAHLTDSNGLQAWTQPVLVGRR